MNYVIAPTSKDILHYGRGHDDSPPGRGSGRYAWGSGKKPGGIVRSMRVKHYKSSNGKYTQIGVNRYEDSLKNYQKAQAKYEQNPTDANKNALKIEKKKLNDSYDKLKLSRRADKGYELYKKGKTITDEYGNMEVQSIFTNNAVRNGAKIVTKYGLGTTLLASMSKNGFDAQKLLRDKKSLIALGAVAAATGAVKVGAKIKSKSDIRNMRAYTHRKEYGLE